MKGHVGPRTTLKTAVRSWAWLLAAAALNAPGASVATRDAQLRSGCGADTAIRVTVPAGTPLTIRSMMSGDMGPCYKVAATVNGAAVEGYIDPASIGGLEEFERSRREAERLDWGQVESAFHLPAIQPAAPDRAAGGNASTSLAAQAMSLIQANQPQRALQILEPGLKGTHDPDLLAVAGAAAWRSDDIPRALEYWKASLELRPNVDLQVLYGKLLRENQNDHAGARLLGMRVQLRYDADGIRTETARQMLGTLDAAYARIAAELGCPAQERVTAVAQTREDYVKSTQAAEWSGGQYDGRIHIPITGKPGENLDRTLAHEMVHACLTMMGQWPAWLQEGVAQKLSGDTLGPVARKQLTAALKADLVPHLWQLGQDWSRLDGDSARMAYAESLAAVELFVENNGLGLRNLLRSPERLPAVAADLDRRLRE